MPPFSSLCSLHGKDKMMEIEKKEESFAEEEEEEEDGVSCLAAKRMKLMPPSPSEGERGKGETEREQVSVRLCIGSMFVTMGCGGQCLEVIEWCGL